MKKLIAVLGLLIIAGGIAGTVFLWRSGGEPSPMLDVNADQLTQTVVTPHLEQPIEPGKNILWCSTFQLAWNEACDLIGEDIHMKDEPPMVAVLDKKTATKGDLDEASYLAMAGWTDEGIVEKIREAFRAKFPQEVPPNLSDAPADERSLIAYAYLAKDLKFAEPFEPIDRMNFKGTPVKAFGLTSSTGRAGRIAAQIVILDVPKEFTRDPEFIIELKTDSENDRLILAKVKPAATLQETVRQVQERIAGSTPSEGDSYTRLRVPKLNFRILKNYDELLKKNLVLSRTDLDEYFFLVASQMIRFRLDEHGAVLRSEGKAEAMKSAWKAALIFDEPFLILLQRKDAANPYFALWVDNAELLVPAQ